MNRFAHYSPFSRNSRLHSESRIVSTPTEKQLYLSPQPSLEQHKQRYRLLPLLNHEFSRSKPQEVEGDRLDHISSEIRQLQEELAHKQSLRRNLDRSILPIKTTKLGQEGQYTIRYSPEAPQSEEPLLRSQIWQNPDIFQTTSRKRIKVYKLKNRKRQHLPPETEDLPVIGSIRRGRSRGNSYKEYFYQITKTPARRAGRRRFHALRSFRKAVHVVLFLIFLKTFNERMRRNRQGFFGRFTREESNEKLLALKSYLIENSQPLFLELISQHDFDNTPHEKDEPRLQQEKVKSLKRLVGLEIQCLESCLRTMANKEYFTDLLYYMCKHGSYASYYQMHTQEELSLMCISEEHGYMRGDKELEKAAILSLLFIKILIFNVLLQPHKVPLLASYSSNQTLIHKNLRLVANILYELLIDIQDDFLERAPPLYTVGNWKHSKMEIKSAHSMTVKAGFYQKNEVISGLTDHKLIKDTYSTRYMIDFKRVLEELVKLLHQTIVKFHELVRKKHY